MSFACSSNDGTTPFNMPSTCTHATRTFQSSNNRSTTTSRNVATNLNDCQTYERISTTVVFIRVYDISIYKHRLSGGGGISDLPERPLLGPQLCVLAPHMCAQKCATGFVFRRFCIFSYEKLILLVFWPFPMYLNRLHRELMHFIRGYIETPI